MRISYPVHTLTAENDRFVMLRSQGLFVTSQAGIMRASRCVQERMPSPREIKLQIVYASRAVNDILYGFLHVSNRNGRTA